MRTNEQRSDDSYNRPYMYDIKTTIDHKSGTIALTEGFRDFVNDKQLQIINTKEKAIREALMKLGWTPPKE